MTPPTTYATEAEARAYVTRVLTRPPASSPAKVYVIASPSLPGSPAWPAIAARLGVILPGAEVVTYAELFAPPPPRKRIRDRPVQERLETISRTCRGAVVIPRKWRDGDGPARYLLGYPARLEAVGMLAAGLPVLVFVPGGLVAWPDVNVHPAVQPSPHFAPIEVDLPAAPEGGVILPTVAASYRALGLPRPRPWRPPPPRPVPAEAASA